MIGFLDFVLWCAQEAGVLVSVGAALLVLIGYIVAMRDGAVSPKEAEYSKNAHRVLAVGLVLMMLSGLAIIALHFSLAQVAIVTSPVFVFKWLLILGLAAVYIALRKQPYGHHLVEGALGATWLTLFIVHTVAPAVSWGYLLILYALVTAGFMVLWDGIVRITRESRPHAPALKAAPAAAAIMSMPVAPKQPVAQKLASPAPVLAAAVPPAPVAAPVSAPAPLAPPPHLEPHHSHWLPMIHVMPSSPQALEEKSHITPLSAFKKVA